MWYIKYKFMCNRVSQNKSHPVLLYSIMQVLAFKSLCQVSYTCHFNLTWFRCTKKPKTTSIFNFIIIFYVIPAIKSFPIQPKVWQRQLI